MKSLIRYFAGFTAEELVMWTVFFAISATALTFPIDAFAQTVTFGAGGPADGVINTQQYFQNNLARPIGGLLIGVSGFRLVQGHHNWYDFAVGLAGIGVMVKPDWIMTNLYKLAA